MKKFYRLVSLVLVSVVLFTCTSCGNSSDKGSTIPDLDEGEIVMKYGDLTLNEKEFMYIVSYMKNYYVLNQQSAYYQSTGTLIDEKTLLNMKISGDKILADYIKEAAIGFAQQMLVMEKLANDAGVKITDQGDLDDIQNYISDIEFAYGGPDLFDIALIRLGFSRSGIERLLRFEKLTELMQDYRYGENGKARIPAETVTKEFVDNYLCYEGFVFSYVDKEKAGYITYEFTDDEIVEYFNENYVHVRHILYKTDSSNKDSKKSEAEADLALLKSGEKKFEDLVDKNCDGREEYTFTKGVMVEEFETASFEMQVGDICLVETEFGYHIIEKLEKDSSVLFEKTEGKEDEENETMNEVVVEMSKAKIRKQALEIMDKLNNGEITEIPKKVEGFDNYTVLEKSYSDKNGSGYTKRIEMIEKLEIGKCGEYDSSTEGIYVFKKLDFTGSDITSSVYTEIESGLINEAFSKYISSFYDKIEIDNELVKKFDIITIPLLEEEFYSAN